MIIGKNRRSGKKFITVRLSPDRLSFHTSALVDDGGGRDYKIVQGSESDEVSIRFSTKLEQAENIRRALAKCLEMTGWDGWPVRVMFDTRKTILIPEALFDPEQVADYLRINNIDVHPDQSIILSRMTIGDDSANLIMVYDKEAVDTIKSVFGDSVLFTSVLDASLGHTILKHKKKDTGKEFTTLYLTAGNAYIAIRSIPAGELRYCEILPCSSPADILYYMQELAGKFDIRQTPVYVSGDGSEEICRTLRNHFTKTKCE